MYIFDSLHDFVDSIRKPTLAPEMNSPTFLQKRGSPKARWCLAGNFPAFGNCFLWIITGVIAVFSDVPFAALQKYSMVLSSEQNRERKKYLWRRDSTTSSIHGFASCCRKTGCEHSTISMQQFPLLFVECALLPHRPLNHERPWIRPHSSITSCNSVDTE